MITEIHAVHLQKGDKVFDVHPDCDESVLFEVIKVTYPNLKKPNANVYAKPLYPPSSYPENKHGEVVFPCKSKSIWYMVEEVGITV